MNLLQETIDILADFGKSPSDVRWVGSADGVYAITWAEFAAIADFYYEEGFGTREIARDLVVVGPFWWLERESYDGAENWVFKKLPVLRRKSKKHTAPKLFDRVTSDIGGDPIAYINETEEEE